MVPPVAVKRCSGWAEILLLKQAWVSQIKIWSYNFFMCCDKKDSLLFVSNKNRISERLGSRNLLSFKKVVTWKTVWWEVITSHFEPTCAPHFWTSFCPEWPFEAGLEVWINCQEKLWKVKNVYCHQTKRIRLLHLRDINFCALCASLLCGAFFTRPQHALLTKRYISMLGRWQFSLKGAWLLAFR